MELYLWNLEICLITDYHNMRMYKHKFSLLNKKDRMISIDYFHFLLGCLSYVISQMDTGIFLSFLFFFLSFFPSAIISLLIDLFIYLYKVPSVFEMNTCFKSVFIY